MEEVRPLVGEVTDDKSLPKEDRKRRQAEHAPDLSDGASLIRLADLASNVTDLTERPPADRSVARRREYLDWEPRRRQGAVG